MFVITFKKDHFTHHMNDVDTAADVIMGVTGKDQEYERTLAIMGNMLIGDMFISNESGFVIQCVEDDKC